MLNGKWLGLILIARERDPAAYVDHSMQSMARHVAAMLDLKRAGAVTFDYGNNIRIM